MNHTALDGPSRIVCVSIPRSGHHYLAVLLRGVLAQDCYYCEYYTPVDCCRAVPCTRGGTAAVVIQKNHDFDLSLPTDLAGVTYVVQYRRPVMAALSDREYLERLEGAERADDLDEYPVWLGKKAAHFHRFWNKWIRPHLNGRVVVAYEDLLAEPTAVVQRILDAAHATARADIAAVVRDTGGIVADFPAPSVPPPLFVERNIEKSRYFDPALLAVYESVLIANLPELEPTRLLARRDAADHPVSLVYRAELSAAGGAHADAVALLTQATQVAPGNAFLWLELSLAHLRLGDLQNAISAGAEAVRLRPNHALMLRHLSDLTRARGSADLGRSTELARQLVALKPKDAGNLVHLASLLLARREDVEAEGLVARAMEDGQADPFLWRECSEILAVIGRLGPAVAAVREAILRHPNVAEFHHHLGNLFFRLGLPSDALQAHSRALELEPHQVAWRLHVAKQLALCGRVADARDLVKAGLARSPDDADLLQAHAGLVAIG